MKKKHLSPSMLTHQLMERFLNADERAVIGRPCPLRPGFPQIFASAMRDCADRDPEKTRPRRAWNHS